MSKFNETTPEVHVYFIMRCPPKEARRLATEFCEEFQKKHADKIETTHVEIE